MNVIQTRMIFANTSALPTDGQMGQFSSPSVTSPSPSSTELETLVEDREVEEPWDPCREGEGWTERAGWQEKKVKFAWSPTIVCNPPCTHERVPKQTSKDRQEEHCAPCLILRTSLNLSLCLHVWVFYCAALCYMYTVLTTRARTDLLKLLSWI